MVTILLLSYKNKHSSLSNTVSFLFFLPLLLLLLFSLSLDRMQWNQDGVRCRIRRSKYSTVPYHSARVTEEQYSTVQYGAVPSTQREWQRNSKYSKYSTVPYHSARVTEEQLSKIILLFYWAYLWYIGIAYCSFLQYAFIIITEVELADTTLHTTPHYTPHHTTPHHTKMGEVLGRTPFWF